MWKDVLHAAARNVEPTADLLKRRVAGKLGRPEPVQIVPFRGYAARGVVHLQGRVLEKEHEPGTERDSIWDNLIRTYRRYESDEVPGARLIARFGTLREELESDEEGYFELELSVPELPAEPWQEIDLELQEPRMTPPARAKGEFLHVLPQAEIAIVSDLDDTVVRTGATNRLRMARIILFNNARTRVPFPGVAAFYGALARSSRNPIFYVSSSPWNLYDLFVRFLEHHGLPRGPLFMKDFGVDEAKLFKSGHSAFKKEKVERLLEAYPRLPFLLIGDSGQKDAEIYRDMVRRHPGRVAGVYLREVGAESSRARALLEEIEAEGVPTRMAAETESLAEHAAARGWIPADALEKVRERRELDEERKHA